MKQTVQHQRGSTQGHCTVVLTLNPTPVPARDRRVYVPQSMRECVGHSINDREIKQGAWAGMFRAQKAQRRTQDPHPVS